MGSILYQKIVPPNGGGDTLFASMYAAYDALSPQMKAFLEPLTAEHDGALAYDKGAKTVYPVSVHPVITRHPETGKKVSVCEPDLYVADHGAAESRERRGPWLSLRAHRRPALAGPLSLDEPFDRVLGQPLHTALRDLGLLAERPIGIPGADQRHRTTASGKLNAMIVSLP